MGPYTYLEKKGILFIWLNYHEDEDLKGKRKFTLGAVAQENKVEKEVIDASFIRLYPHVGSKLL